MRPSKRWGVKAITSEMPLVDMLLDLVSDGPIQTSQMGARAVCVQKEAQKHLRYRVPRKSEMVQPLAQGDLGLQVCGDALDGVEAGICVNAGARHDIAGAAASRGHPPGPRLELAAVAAAVGLGLVILCDRHRHDGPGRMAFEMAN